MISPKQILNIILSKNRKILAILLSPPHARNAKNTATQATAHTLYVRNTNKKRGGYSILRESDGGEGKFAVTPGGN